MSDQNKWGTEWPVIEKAVDDWANKEWPVYFIDPNKDLINSEIVKVSGNNVLIQETYLVSKPQLKSAASPLEIIKGIDLALQSDKTVISKGNHHSELKSQGSNLMDQNQYLYFQCEGCGDIFDPETKSFKTLDEKRHAAGWKVKWNIDGMGYKVYCPKCKEGVV